ncbi:type VI secretion system lipoprotein TssJ [Trinickia terrae]|uniref:Type VI secretion system lipoprotein TssJ n=1 Tax=Trinickia terrae TaxID=2571161 RepID=A0A4U1HDG9_9BURK|nr:type VI secretion system lipoprotein TssJ [Trinickia terrae]TKC78931.1 type VI secretion system lipoprotein TssJ [Trinickia terrae]
MRMTSVVAAIASGLVLSACGAWQSVSDGTASAYHAVFHKQVKVLDVDLNARASLNPDEAQRPTSVVVRVYQLKDRKTFDSASYDDLLKNDRVLLAQDLLDMKGVRVTPGGAVSVTQPIQADARYVAVVAFFRDPVQDKPWRRVIEKKALSADDPLKLELVANELVLPSDVARERPGS